MKLSNESVVVELKNSTVVQASEGVSVQWFRWVADWFWLVWLLMLVGH